MGRSVADYTNTGGWRSMTGAETGQGGANTTALGGCLANQRLIYLQQKSKVYKPDYRPANLWKYYLIAAGVFLLVGIALGIQALMVKELVIDYSICEHGKPCEKNLDKDSDMFKDGAVIKGPILIYYYIEDFHQNHRGYEDDRDDKQLAGSTAVGKDCKNNNTELPCGFAANTMFTDKILDITDQTGINSQVKVQMTNPILKTDLSYSMESDAYTPPPKDATKSVKPKDWDATMWDQYKNNDESFLQDFRVWMRLAPLPRFRKLWYRMGDQLPELKNGTIKIDVKWPPQGKVHSNLKKKVILTQQSFMGAKSFNKCFISLAIVVLFGVCGFFLWHLAGEDGKYETKREKVEAEKANKRR